MENLPGYISIVFILTTILTIGIFYKASHNSKSTLLVLTIWLLAQTFIGLSGFYNKTNSFPPRFLLLVLPPLLLIIGLFVSPKGRVYIDSMNIRILTILHMNRILVEFVLF